MTRARLVGDSRLYSIEKLPFGELELRPVEDRILKTGEEVTIGKPFAFYRFPKSEECRYIVPFENDEMRDAPLYLRLEDLDSKVFSSLRLFNATKSIELSHAALEGMRHALTVHNKPDDYRVGAAVLTTKGKIYSAGSYHSDTHSLTLHAEHACLSHAASHGEYGIRIIAIISNDDATDPIYPCGLCKQLLWESHLRTNEDILIVSLRENHNRISVVDMVHITEMMLYPWPLKKE